MRTRALGAPLVSLLLVGALAPVASGCDAILGLSSKTLGTLDGGEGTPDTGTADAGDTGPSGVCPADGAPAPGYHDLTSPTCWTTFDLMAVDPNAHDLAGGTFDGRYIYFPSDVTGTIARLDTTTAFDVLPSWTTFDTTMIISSGIPAFQGAVFDGRYVVFVPAGSAAASSPLAARYDTHEPFGSSASWATYDTTPLDANGTSWAGGTFDGRYVYLAPNGDGVVARLDTQAKTPFTSSTSWTTYDVAGVNAMVSGFFGAVFDGRYVYFVPYGANSEAYAARYDTRASFTAASSWTTFSVSSVTPGAYGFQGGAFDGRNVYLSPTHDNNGAPGGPALQYDNASSFVSTSSWSAFSSLQLDMNAISYYGATFDGRYVYFAPTGSGDTDNGFVLRYDTTTNAFSLPSSWGGFDTTTVSSSAFDYNGAVFDGRYVYFIPFGSVVARFDAREPGPLPSLGDSGVPYHGSFF